MLKTLEKAVGRDNDFPARVADLTLMRMVLEGTVYDCLKHDFHEERASNGEYIPLAKRRPSVRYNLCRLLVEDVTSLLFGEGRFPTVACTDANVVQTLADVVDETGLVAVMEEAALKGSVGSVAILMRVLKGRVFFDVQDTTYLTPEWDPEAPDTLLSVAEQYKVRGRQLADLGYAVEQAHMDATFWFRRVWSAEAETWFLPWLVNAMDPNAGPVIDKERTVQHALGFVPLVWIKNLPGGNGIDGDCTFRPAIDNQIEIEYQLSQGGRGLKYSSDPTLLLKEPAGTDDGNLVRSASNAIVVDAEGDAKMLEINGTAVAAVIEYAKALRELALESIHGNRSNADRVSAAQSGRALEMLHQSLIWLADRLRVSYGERGLLPLLRMVIMARRKMALQLFGEAMPAFPANVRIKLVWPPWFHPTERDKAEQATRVGGLYEDGLIAQETAVTLLQDANGVSDVPAELAKIAADVAAKDARAAALGSQVKESATLPA